MSWRTVCISKRCKLEYRMGYMVVRGSEIKRIHLKEIGLLIVESTAVSLTSSLLNELMKKKTKIIFCDEQHNPTSELIHYYGSHDSSKVIQKQIMWDEQIKGIVWKLIIQDKILKQAKVLEISGKETEAKLLRSYINQVKHRDITNREGHAAKVYFHALFGMNFNRDQDSFVNSALDYGYSIILSLFNREINALGRLTQLGIWHDNMFNYFNLSSDFMEPFRPLLDLHVIQIAVNFASDDELSKEAKYCILKLLEKEIMLNGKNYKLPNCIKVYVRSLIQTLDGNNLSYMPVITYV